MGIEEPVRPTYLPVMEEKLYFEGAGRVRSISNYVVLLTLATAIATYGLISSASSATVIGAMIVAPLMTPIMATTLAHRPRELPRVSRSVLIVGLSIVYVVALAAALSGLIPSLVIDFGTNPEIGGRASDMIALYAALASGAAGAFAVSRADIGDTLPGVAIAISLVPPLCVVGIALSHLQWLDAFGALILFLTNFFAIVLAGGAVFWLSGVRPRPSGAAEAHLHRRALALAVLGTIVVAAVLGFNGYRTYQAADDAAITELTAASTACCRCASARRPRPAGSCLARPRRIAPGSCSALPPTPPMRTADPYVPQRSLHPTSHGSTPCWPASLAVVTSCRRCIRP